MKRLLLTVAGVGLTTSLVFAQTQTVRGVVVEAGTGEPVIGANVIVKGHSGVGVSTNLDGKFTLNAPKGATHLIISYIGYKKAEVAIKSDMKITLQPEAAALDDVVVVGYGSARKVASVVSSVVSVKAKELEAKPTANPLEALQGKVSGLQMFVNSGEPSEVASLRLRGTGSLGASSDPLFVLDGAPVTPTTIRGINANDIESVQVLKDASATSIYGARAANGVIYITTKRGKIGDTAQVTIRGQYGLSNLANRDYFNSVMRADELLAFQKEVGLLSQEGIDKIKKAYPHDTDWACYAYRHDRPSYQTDIAVSGGAGSTRYYLSAGRQYQEGLRHGSDYGKSAFRVNLNTAINKRITLGTNNSLSLDKFHESPYGGPNPLGGIIAMIFPWYTPYNEDGTDAVQIEGLGRNTPAYETSKTIRERRFTTLNSASFIQYKPIDNLTLRSQFAYEHKNYVSDRLRYPSHINNLNNGYRYIYNELAKSLTWTNTAEYKFKLGQKHSLIALAGHEFVDYDEQGYDAQGEGLTHDLLTTMDQLTKEKKYDAVVEQYAFLSYFARLSYDYIDRYFADLTVRNDASSRFGKNKQSATFWSLGLMWKAKQEHFLKNVSWLDDLKVKYSIGTQGNAQISNYDSYALAGKVGQANGITGWGITTTGNPDLSWEKQFSTSLGFEFSLFKKLNVNLEFYHRLTSDMLMAVPFPYHTGFIDNNGYNNITQNVGKYQNRGIDLGISYDILRNKKGEGLTAYLNLNYNNDKVVSLFQGLNSWTVSDQNLGYVVGKPVTYFTPIWAGVNPDNGDPQWYLPSEDNTHKTTEKVTNKYSESLEQNTDIRRYAPVNGGFGLKANYKGFSLDADFAFSLGKYMVSNDNFFYENPTPFLANWNQRRTIKDYWKKKGDNTTFPRYGVQFTQFDTRLISNASFARLKTLSLGYSLPKSLLAKQKFVKGAKFYITGRNLLTFTKFSGPDPEANKNLVMGSNPNTKQVVAGFEINF